MKNDTISAADDTAFKRIISVTVLIYAAFLVMAVVLLAYYNITDKNVLKSNSEYTYVEHWTVTEPDGYEFETGRTYQADKSYRDGYVISTVLPDTVSENSVLCMIIANDYEAYVNGELRSSLDFDRDIPFPGGSVKAFYVMIPVGSGDAGGLVQIHKRSISSHPLIVTEAFITDIKGVYAFLLRNYGVTLGLSVMMFIISAIVAIVSLCMRIWYKREIDLFYAAMGILVISTWLVSNSYLYPFIFGHYHIDGIINYLACLTMPFGLLKYLDSIQEGRHRRFIAGMLIVSSINAILWTALHFTGIFNFSYALTYIDIILAILVATVVVLLIIEFKKGYTRLYRYTAIGFAGFLVSSLGEIYVLMFTTTVYDSFPMLLGLGWLLTFVVLQQVNDLRLISEEKQRAIALSDAKTNFLASMSHEIRTPINSILGMNEMILRENKDEVIDEYARTVRNSGKMLLSLVNDVLDFSRIESGRLEITPDKYSLSRMVHDINSTMTERADQKGLDYLTLIDGSVPDGQIADEFRIKQILINLISNAVKYTDKGQVELIIGGEYGDNPDAGSDPVYMLNLSVKDTGRGIKKEDIDGLFDAFSRVDLKKNSNIEGTGLGLAIVKSIVESMSGEVSVDSEYGAGSRFNVVIPVRIYDRSSALERFRAIPDESRADIPAEKNDMPAFYAPDAKVLAVDDNGSNLTIVRLFLKRLAISPELCNNGNDALKKCREKKYDLILLDHMMPSPDGIETLHNIQTDPRSLNRDTPAIVLTANAVAGVRTRYIDAGFKDYLTKPLDSALLEQTVEKYLPGERIVRLEPGRSEKSPVHRVQDEEVMEFAPERGAISDEDRVSAHSYEDKPVAVNKKISMKRLYASIEELNYETAISHCVDDTILMEILGDINKECGEKITAMRTSLEKGDLKAYEVDAHSIKGLMATIGAQELSDRARKQESAAHDGNMEYIMSEVESFLAAYEKLCSMIGDGLI